MLSGGVAVLLGAPAVLGFFTGGYFDEPRLWAGLVVWGLALLALLLGRDSVPRGRSVWVALASLALLAAWSLLSIAWAPVADTAYASAQRVALYAGVLLAAVELLRAPCAQRWVEPGLAGGALVLVGYSLSERLLPGLVHLHHSASAEGRLEQPLTYWNAMGEVAGLGLVLAARLAGDSSRPRALRAAGAAAAAPLGMGLYLTFSRGALFACAAGLLALIVAAPVRVQLRAVLLSLGAAVLASLAAAPFSGVSALAGNLARRERQGAITLGLLALVVLAAAALGWRGQRLQIGAGGGALRLPRRAPLIALCLVCAGLALAILGGARESSQQPLAPGATRLVTLRSDRYDYWRVGLRAFAHQPLRGIGAGNWSTYWLRWRPYDVGAQDAHSLPIQTLAELGIVGLALLLAGCGAIVLGARRAHRVGPALAAGPIAGLVTYLAHAPLDWDWELPAVTLIAVTLAGALLALGEGGGARRSAVNAARRPAVKAWPAPRIAVLALAGLMVAWFGLGLRQVLSQAQVTNLLLVHRSLTLAQSRGANSTLDEALFLNPDQSVRATRVIIARRSGDLPRAIRIAEDITRYEPENINSWLLLGLLVEGRDPATSRQVQERLAALAPPVPLPR